MTEDFVASAKWLKARPESQRQARRRRLLLRRRHREPARRAARPDLDAGVPFYGRQPQRRGRAEDQGAAPAALRGQRPGASTPGSRPSRRRSRRTTRPTRCTSTRARSTASTTTRRRATTRTPPSSRGSARSTSSTRRFAHSRPGAFPRRSPRPAALAGSPTRVARAGRDRLPQSSWSGAPSRSSARSTRISTAKPFLSGSRSFSGCTRRRQTSSYAGPRVDRREPVEARDAALRQDARPRGAAASAGTR